MRRTAQLVLGLALSLVLAGNLMALPQEQEKQEKAAQAEKSGEAPKEQKPKVEDASKDDEDKETSVTMPHSVRGLGERFLLDQKQIWTSPAKLRYTDLGWIIPAGGFTSMLFFTDKNVSSSISHNPTTVSHYDTISNAGIAALLGGAAGMWLLSYPKHNEHWRETGFLAGA